MFGIHPVSWFSALPNELAVFLLSMIPITELRAAIPIGIEVYGLSPINTWILAVVGNAVPAAILLCCMPYIHDFIIEKKVLGRLLTTQLRKAEKKFSGKYAKYGALGLVLFVGIPLPLTGAWTGTLAAFVFNIPFKKSFILIFAGICLAATIMTFVTLFFGRVV